MLNKDKDKNLSSLIVKRKINLGKIQLLNKKALIKELSKQEWEKVRVQSKLVMVLIQEIGKTTWRKATDRWCIKMVIITKEIGKEINSAVRVNTMKMRIANTMDNFYMESIMEMELWPTIMGTSTKENMNLEKNTVMVSMIGKIKTIMMASGGLIQHKGTVLLWLEKNFMMETLKMVKNTDKESVLHQKVI